MTQSTADTGAFLISLEKLQQYFGLDLERRAINVMIRDGRLPRPIKSSPARCGRIFFVASEVREAVSRWPRVQADTPEREDAAA